MAKDVFDLDVGDILSVYDRDFIVKQVSKLAMGNNPTAVNCCLEDGRETRWFAARKSNPNILAIGEEIQLEVNQIGEKITFKDVSYLQSNKFKGRAISSSDLGYPRYVSTDYFDYKSESSDKYLFIQKSGDDVTAFYGEPVIASAVMVFPKPK